jgi:hypothetical protein
VTREELGQDSDRRGIHTQGSQAIQDDIMSTAIKRFLKVQGGYPQFIAEQECQICRYTRNE